MYGILYLVIKINDKLTTNLTNEFEEAFISTQCCDVLERREYDKLVSHGVYMTNNIAEGLSGIE